ncbi:TVG1148602 [Thermoplasma volcanium GSS1]|uniref:TVG1148602 protein n=1 Tax=Thermoplasma volcanium (strain ATCC 51530 / DSM 4299 / JCM 9571 / NBRC 15438 / GSS1) TaxID=273116 RepID=Q979P4_THEVO|nr:hypothetical protein [Thermoplasma volcanium]BAB60258.1 TVG1148602 [Thermoplasma volcanium GSS1]
MKIEIGQRIDVEVDREDVERVSRGSIIAVWYNRGVPIYVELFVNKTLISEIRKMFNNNNRKSALVSITRISKSKYVVEPTVVVLNRQRTDLTPIK